jgi:DNA-binding transcriptional regulator YiaG
MSYLFDRESYCLAITFAVGRQYRDSEEVVDGVVIDFDAEGKPYAVEFLQADKLVDVRGLIDGRPTRLTPEAIAETVEVSPSFLRRWRERLGLSQEELASRLQVAPETIDEWETGDKPIENTGVLRLALKAIEGNAHEEHLRQALRDVTEALQKYLKDESGPLKLASSGRTK